ncbi:DUF547 domain-containing protein [Parashewanella curva]|uniref:DUF547 domain-containing protein n=1 Tax=Parashewanella curva TaxID=2338552 RepID=A0A3L8Q0P4_9GAMM|nr:DUF547 domain-containing protein [Parashewanella curva]RLV61155.1 DUF547 domain-containing protein [Parashewanella curva]
MKKVVFTIFSLVIAALLYKGYSFYSAITPQANTFWQVSNQNSTQIVDHQAWQILLDRYLLEEENFRVFNYSTVSSADKQALKDYIQSLSSIDPRQLNRNEQLAYWVNLYNALTVDLVVEHYPIASIKEIGDGITGPWNIEAIEIADQAVTLNQIEHKILRPIWQDPRIHYVINCASLGCPDLPYKALSSSDIEYQLNQAAVMFINQNKGVDINNEKLVLSSIYNWFSEDFGENQTELMTHISQFAKPELKNKLAEITKQKSFNIEFQYDWKLNVPLAGHVN